MKWFGNVFNRMVENQVMPKPEIGMGVTEMYWSDREPYEVVDIKDERHITVRELDAKRTDDHGMSEDQRYEFSSNPEGRILNLFKTKNGEWRERIGRNGLGCNKFVIGYADKYYDYSF